MNDNETKTALEESVRAATAGTEVSGDGAKAPAESSEKPAGSLAEMAAAAASVPEDQLREEIVAVLQSIYDPEIPVNIHELGLIYGIDIAEGGAVEIQMTLTAPGCPVAGPMVAEVEFKVAELAGVSTCHAELVWDPPWTMEKMSEAARLQLGMF